MALQLHDLLYRLFPVLRGLSKDMKQNFFVLSQRLPLLIQMLSNPGGSRKVLQKLLPLNSTTIIDIDVLEQSGQFVIHNIVVFVDADCPPEQPQELLQIQFILIEMELLLNGINATTVERNKQTPHIVCVLRIYHQFLLLPQHSYQASVVHSLCHKGYLLYIAARS